MDQDSDSELQALIARLRQEVLDLSARVAGLEQRLAAPAAPPSPAASENAAPVPAAPIPRGEVSEEEMLAISAAVAAFLGVRARIRQVRLIHSTAWAQVGRVTVQAAHRRR